MGRSLSFAFPCHWTEPAREAVSPQRVCPRFHLAPPLRFRATLPGVISKPLRPLNYCGASI